MIVVPLGVRAVLVEMTSTAAVLGLYGALRSDSLPGHPELVPAARSLMALFGSTAARVTGQCELERRLASLPELSAPSGGAEDVETVTVDVVYDGDDLVFVGERTGLGVAGVISAHTGRDWTVAFSGFAPGFGYLTGGDPRLSVPRRAVPRTQVPAGAVGLAGEFSGIYPRASPGGWQLIGRSSVSLWDSRRVPPALLRPGVRVRFRQVTELVAAAVPQSVDPGRSVAAGLRVLRSGVFTTVQDAGRPGYAELGVTGSGAADREAVAEAQLLVGNPDGTAALELTLGGLRVQAIGRQRVAVTGAPVTLQVVRSDGASETAVGGTVVELADGDTVIVGHPPTGLRSYLAVAGGIDVPLELGSRSTDVLSGLGPAPVRRGDVLPVGAFAPSRSAGGGRRRVGAEPLVHSGPLSVDPGPHLGYLEPDALQRFCSQEWVVSTESNRVGLRVSGSPIGRRVDDEMPTAPLVAGAVQVPPSGQPVVFLRDHPVTGGYPVLAVLTEAAVDRAAQARPGDRLTFAVREQR